eukprot:6387840-Prymnesium_polylepis.1
MQNPSATPDGDAPDARRTATTGRSVSRDTLRTPSPIYVIFGRKKKNLRGANGFAGPVTAVYKGIGRKF